MAYPSLNDREHDLLKKITENTAALAAGGISSDNPLLNGYRLAGSRTVIPYAMGAGTVIDVEEPNNIKSVTADVTLTFSNNTPAIEKEFRLTLNADGTKRTVTIPSSYSINRQGTITSVIVPASGTIILGFKYTGTRWEVFGDPVSDDLKTYIIGFSADGGGSAIATGKIKGFATAKATGTIRAWTNTVDTGTPVIKVWKIAAGTAKPTAANAINTSGVGVTSGTHVRSTTLTDFTTTTVTQGDILAFNIESNTGSATEISFGLEIVIS